MGLFDKILKGAVDAIDNAAAKSGNGPTGLKDLFNQAMDKKNEAINGHFKLHGFKQTKHCHFKHKFKQEKQLCLYKTDIYHTAGSS